MGAPPSRARPALSPWRLGTTQCATVGSRRSRSQSPKRRIAIVVRMTLPGCGPIKLLALQMLRAAGAGPTVAIDRVPHRRAMATWVGSSVAALSARTGNEGAPLMMEAPGRVKSLLFPNGLPRPLDRGNIGTRATDLGTACAPWAGVALLSLPRDRPCWVSARRLPHAPLQERGAAAAPAHPGWPPSGDLIWMPIHTPAAARPPRLLLVQDARGIHAPMRIDPPSDPPTTRRVGDNRRVHCWHVPC